jgi:5,10-methylene-tetrahydrofolate dehydrogenase/methenyl tetrahydrofolate cyclohydrolase
MIIDGRVIAQNIREELVSRIEHLHKKLVLSVLQLSSDEATKQFIRIKKQTGESIGVVVRVKNISEHITTEELIEELHTAVRESNGVVVQLPLPKHIDRKKIFAELPASHDVDCLGDEARTAFENGGHLLPPVVGACKEILERYSINPKGKQVVVVGKGLLVGGPASVWFKNNGGIVEVVDIGDNPSVFETADIIVLGAGSPHFLKPVMIKEGVVILDAGTSESGGKVVGDADPDCAQKSSLFTPVPGGIGPIAVAKIFENLLLCNGL